MILEIIFWILVSLVIHTYLLYPALILILSSFTSKNAKVFTYNYQPKVSLIIPTHNNEDIIEEKIKNTLELDYPNLEIFVVDDASTDKTVEIIEKYKQIKLLRLFEEQGRLNAINSVAPLTAGKILLFTTPKTFYNKDIISRIISHFDDLKIGCVTGNVKLMSRGGFFVTDEGLYNNYEDFIKTKESELNSVVNVDRALYALRRELFQNLKDFEDFSVTANITKHNYKVFYDKEILGWQYKSPSVREEIKHKSKVITLGLKSSPKLLFSYKDPLTLFQFISHKLLRWLVPEILIAILIINWFLLDISLYQNLFVTQVLFYLFSPLAILISGMRIFSIPYYLFISNFSAFVGFWKFIARKS